VVQMKVLAGETRLKHIKVPILTIFSVRYYAGQLRKLTEV